MAILRLKPRVRPAGLSPAGTDGSRELCSIAESRDGAELDIKVSARRIGTRGSKGACRKELREQPTVEVCDESDERRGEAIESTSRVHVEGAREVDEENGVQPPGTPEERRRVEQDSDNRSGSEKSGAEARKRREKRRGRSFEVAAKVDAEAADRRGSSAPPPDEVQQACWALRGRKILY